LSRRAYDVAVVGAGIVGAALTAELARAGMSVVVLDRGPVGGGATAAGMGHIVVMDDSEAQFALTRWSRSLWEEISPELPDDAEYVRCGTLWVAANEEELAEVRRKEIWYRERGVRVEVLDGAALAAAEPELRPGLAGGLVVPDDAVVYPPCAARFLVERAAEHGADVRTGVCVRRVVSEGPELADGSHLAAGRTVIAAGSWSPSLAPWIPLVPRKGHLLITDRHPGFVRHQLVELEYLRSAHSFSSDSVAFNVQPRRTGQLLVGSSRQYGAEDSAVEPAILSRMLARALVYMPRLGELSAIRAWTGQRAALPDKLPLIGPTPQDERIWLATGHEGLGITTSLGTARLVADAILGRRSEIPCKPYLPARFAGEGTHA